MANSETSSSAASNSAVRTVLITGASSGIGAELAKLFAKDGYNLVLVADNEAGLRTIATQLERQYNPNRFTLIVKDLAKPGAPDELHREILEKGITVNVLVNDAGFGEYGLFIETDLQRELAVIQLNVITLVHLTKLFLREMIARGEGRILQLASVASKAPAPLLAVYGATKSFVLSFTDALINELKDTGVTMTALMPGATDTNFFNAAGAANTRVAASSLADPAVVAKDGYEALMRGDGRVVSGFMNQVQTALAAVIPDGVLAAAQRAQFEEAHSGASGESNPGTPSSEVYSGQSHENNDKV
ncbi:MAG: SDR family oxidoreductase [Rhizobacter sp.]|nr:SDR family oxidoreductase [Chlorobiales bacterium]